MYGQQEARSTSRELKCTREWTECNMCIVLSWACALFKCLFTCTTFLLRVCPFLAFTLSVITYGVVFYFDVSKHFPANLLGLGVRQGSVDLYLQHTHITHYTDWPTNGYAYNHWLMTVAHCTVSRKRFDLFIIPSCCPPAVFVLVLIYRFFRNIVQFMADDDDEGIFIQNTHQWGKERMAL